MLVTASINGSKLRHDYNNYQHKAMYIAHSLYPHSIFLLVGWRYPFTLESHCRIAFAIALYVRRNADDCISLVGNLSSSCLLFFLEISPQINISARVSPMLNHFPILFALLDSNASARMR